MEEVGSSPSSDVCDPPADKELEIGKVYMLPKYSVVFCIYLFPNHFSCVHFLPSSISLSALYSPHKGAVHHP